MPHMHPRFVSSAGPSPSPRPRGPWRTPGSRARCLVRPPGLVTGCAVLGLVAGIGCLPSGAESGTGGASATGGRAASGGSSTGGTSSTGGSPGTGGNTGSGGATSTGGSAATGGRSATGGTTASGGSASGGTSPATGGAGTGGQGTGGAATGTGGVGGTTAGTGGRASGGAGGVSGGTGGGGGASSLAGCPADATFCSGFESSEFPPGAKYVTYEGSNNPTAWTKSFAVDTTVFRNGKSSLRVRSKKEANGPTDPYRMLSVATPGPAFWVHFYLRGDIELGTSERVHNEFGAAAGSADPNDPTSLEFAEDRGLAFNSHDDVRRPAGYSFDKPYLLPPNKWYCIELGFDSATRHQVMYVDGMKLIDATDFPAASAIKSPFAAYNFGLRDYHGFEGAMWIDDLIVSKTRVPCQ
jgi:hypothetical protein